LSIFEVEWGVSSKPPERGWRSGLNMATFSVNPKSWQFKHAKASKVLPLSEKMKAPNKERKKKWMPKLLRSTVRDWRSGSSGRALA
jgi:hypothetical protein